MFDILRFGETLYNLDIELMLGDTDFGKSLSPLDIVESYGKAITSAKKWLKGGHHITNKGYLLPHHKPDYEIKKARLDIDKNVNHLIWLNEDLEGRHNHQLGRPHFHYESGDMDYVMAEGSRLYLPDRRPQ